MISVNSPYTILVQERPVEPKKRSSIKIYVEEGKIVIERPVRILTRMKTYEKTTSPITS
jgi:hypothetical protein